ncbi:MAG TPA: AAA family ATPase [archaeon]|nr:AAA family ATPase [archaeon]
MLLKSIHLENIRSYLDEKINFPSGSILLSGDVGCGKSTILLAMDFALFGLRKGELEGTDLLRHGKNNGSVEIAFEIEGNNIVLMRTLKRSKTSVTQDSGIISINGREQELMPVELKSRILELFGYPQEVLKKNQPLFRYTVYTPQEKMKDILLDAELRLATLRKIFSVDKYGQIKNNTKLLMTELRSMKRENESFARDLEQKMGEKEERETEKDRVMVLLDKYIIELSAVDAIINEKQFTFDSLKKKMNEISAVKREMARLEGEMKMKSGRLPHVEKELKDTNDKISAFSISETLDVRLLREEIRDLEQTKEKAISQHAVVLSEQIRLESVLKNGICSFCNQRVTDPKDFRKHLDEKNHICEELKKNMEFASAKIVLLKERVQHAEKIEHEKKLLQEYVTRKNQLYTESNSLAADIAALRSELEMLSQQAGNEEELEESYIAVQDEINSINKSRNETDKLKSRCEQQLYDIDHFLKSVEKEIAEKRVAKEKVIYLNELINWFDVYFITLMGIIERHVMAALQQVFNEFFQKWFSILMGEQFSVRVDENFSPLIEQNGYITEYTNLSGGEKTAVALAYRLALNKVINSMIDTIKTRDIMILDEPTDGFSSEQLDRIRDVIAELGLKQIILVSHESKIDTFVDNVIKIYKEDHISKVVYN